MRLSILIAATMMATACMTKIERIENPPQTSVPTKGTETHGGDVLRARALDFRDLLTLSQVELDRTSVGGTKIYRKEFKPELLTLWKGVAVAAQRLQPSSLKQDLLAMTQGDTKGNIFADILASPLDVKVFAPATDPNSTKPEYSDCIDYHGQKATAGAKLGDRGGVICVDGKKLAAEAPAELELYALISHEFAHHFNIEEDRAVEIQKFIAGNAGGLLTLGRYDDPGKGGSIEASQLVGKTITLKITALDIWDVTPLPLACDEKLDCYGRVIDEYEQPGLAHLAQGKTTGTGFELTLSPGYYVPGNRVTVYIPPMFIGTPPDRYMASWEIVDQTGLTLATGAVVISKESFNNVISIFFK